MLDMSWGEVMVIGAVALIVIGPKDLPKALRTLGQMTAKVRRMAAEFQGQFNEAMREVELDEIKSQLQGVNESVGSLNQGFSPLQTIRDELKGAVEAPAGQGKPPAEAAPGAAQSGEIRPPVPAQSVVAELPAPSVPPIADPAQSIAAAVRQEEPRIAQEPPTPETSSEKA